MARTRAQENPDAPKPTYVPEGSKPQGRTTAKARDQKTTKGVQDKKRKLENAGGEKANDAQAPASKKTKTAKSTATEDTKPEPPAHAIDKSKLDALLSKYGVHPLQDTRLPKQDEPTPETILSLLYLAMLTSARISHELAYKSVQCLIEAGYHDIETLKKSTWQERTEVLTKGGYTRYREKTATALGELAEFIEKEYGAPQRGLSLHEGLPLIFFYEYRQRSQQPPQKGGLLAYSSAQITPGGQRHWQSWRGHLLRRCSGRLAISGTVHRPQESGDGQAMWTRWRCECLVGCGGERCG